jgi:hypothetical protein
MHVVLKLNYGGFLLKKLICFQVGNAESFSHFCSNQPVPDEVNYL